MRKPCTTVAHDEHGAKCADCGYRGERAPMTELEALRDLWSAVDAAYAGKRADPTCSCPNCRVVRALLAVRAVSR